MGLGTVGSEPWKPAAIKELLLEPHVWEQMDSLARRAVAGGCRATSSSLTSALGFWGPCPLS